MTNIEQYVAIKKQVADLERQLELLKPAVERTVLDADGSKLDTEFGSFKFVYVPKWEYSVDLQSQEKLIKEKIKLMKHKEETEGVAQKISDGGRLVFTSIKV